MGVTEYRSCAREKWASLGHFGPSGVALGRGIGSLRKIWLVSAAIASVRVGHFRTKSDIGITASFGCKGRGMNDGGTPPSTQPLLNPRMVIRDRVRLSQWKVCDIFAGWAAGSRQWAVGEGSGRSAVGGGQAVAETK